MKALKLSIIFTIEFVVVWAYLFVIFQNIEVLKTLAM